MRVRCACGASRCLACHGVVGMLALSALWATCTVAPASAANEAAPAAPVVVFRHGDLGYWCVRSPAVTTVGGRVLAVAELWNYTGNFCACLRCSSQTCPLCSHTMQLTKVPIVYTHRAVLNDAMVHTHQITEDVHNTADRAHIVTIPSRLPRLSQRRTAASTE